jgi:hypothetical protein
MREVEEEQGRKRMRRSAWAGKDSSENKARNKSFRRRRSQLVSRLSNSCIEIRGDCKVQGCGGERWFRRCVVRHKVR